MGSSTSKLDARFRRYRRKGDLRALGDVFDGAAPQMLQLARRFARGDEALAEDAVQSAFLVAMEKAQEFDEDRPVVPWLLGILAMELRRERASAARLPDPRWLADGARLPGTPDDEATERELKELVAAKVEELPETYREAVRAHLFPRGDAGTTAERLGVTKGALHVRVHRGLGLLRGMLPAGAAMAAGLTVGAPRGLAGMRSAVLGGGGTGVAAATSTSALSILSTKVALVVASFGGVALGGAGVALWQADRTSEPLDSASAEVIRGVEATDADVQLRPPGPTDPERARGRTVLNRTAGTRGEPSPALGDAALNHDDWVRLYGEASGYTEYFLLGKRLIALPREEGLGIARAIYPRLETDARQQFGKPFVFREGAPFALQIADLVVHDTDPDVSTYGFDLVRQLALRDFRGNLEAYDSWRASTAGMDRGEVLRSSADWLERRLTIADPGSATELLKAAVPPARQTFTALGMNPQSLLTGPGTAGALEMLIAEGGPGAVVAMEWVHVTPLDAAGYASLIVPQLDGPREDVRRAAAMALAMSGHAFASDELTRRFAAERGIEPNDPRAADLDGWGRWLSDRR